jgi:tetratricopeptide (TPR) repeat protein
MNQLPHPDNLHAQAAEGWLELGNDVEAKVELEKVSRPNQSHPDVLDLRWHIHAHALEWDQCVDVAAAIIKQDPDRADAWIHRSFALHELKRTREALDHLLPVADRFPAVWVIPYNLACYCAQLARLEECKTWFEKALAIDRQSVQTSAADDPDLKPLRDMGGLNPP